ncbi:MAG: S-layer homology domain-containing protein [Chloroflexia bacterium]
MAPPGPGASDGSGQLGDGTWALNEKSAIPSQVVSLAAVTAIAAGGSHSLALSLPASLLAVAWVTATVGGIVTLSATLTGDSGGIGGQTVTFSLRGTIVGTATTNASGVATLSASLGSIPVGNYPTGVGAAFAGSVNYRASSGTAYLQVTPLPSRVWAWGYDASGQLGDGTVGDGAGGGGPRATPSRVVDPGGNLTDVIAIAGGSFHSLALKADGTVWAWGHDCCGQLGDGTVGDGAGGTGDRATPVQVAGLTDVVAIAAGFIHSLALKRDGTVWAWGDDGNGQLGDGTVGDGAGGAGPRATPVQVVGLTGVVGIAAGSFHSLALKADDTVWAWGYDAAGQLGDGTVGDGAGGAGSRATPSQVVSLSGVVAIAGGGFHSLALKADSTVWAWGNDGAGALGDGTLGPDRATPGQVVAPGGGFLTNAVTIAAGSYHSLALKGDGTVWTWGRDNRGQLGDGTVASPEFNATPSQVAPLTGIVTIASGSLHSLALKADGTVWAWGNDGAGQLGDGTVGSPNDSATPSQVVSLTSVVAIAGGGNHSLALQPPVSRQLTTGSTGGGSGTVSPPSATFQDGVVVSVSAVPATGSLFTGWTVDGAAAGWANPLTVTMDQNHTVQATFVTAKTFSADVPGNHPNAEAIAELATRGNILGYDSTHYGPDDGVQRAQMAVLIARATPNGPGTPTNGTLTPPGCTVAGTWDCEDWGNTFTDRSGVPASLWRAAGTLQHYGVAFGYSAGDCASKGRAFPCYGPTDPVSYAQTIAFIARAMIAKGYWVAQPNAPLPGGNVPGVLATPIRTFAFYTGSIPGAPGDWNAEASRGWFAEALWAALDSYWGTDGLLPDDRPGGGNVP